MLRVRALARHELLWLGEAQRFPGPRYHRVRSGLEAARANTKKRDPIPVPEIHVRLNLEHEARERCVDGVDHAAGALPGNRRRRGGEKSLEQHVDTEVGQRAGEEDRRRLARGAG